MYAVQVRDHIMIAHSLPGEVFGPAQNMHGATYVVDATFYRTELGPERILFGSDYPLGWPSAYLGVFDGAKPSEEERRAVLGRPRVPPLAALHA